MLKTLGTRKGSDALNFLKMAGLDLPTEGIGFTYDFTNQGVVVTATELPLAKGKNHFALPTPALSNSVLLLVAPAPALLDVGTVDVPLTTFDKSTVLAAGVNMTLTTKGEGTYNGPLAHYYLITSF